MRRNGTAERTVRATRAARNHLDAGLREGYRDSIGSLIGHLDSILVHDKYEARLWPDHGGLAVRISFDAGMVEQVKEHLGARVEATGRIQRDGAGNVASLKLRDLERLADFEDSPPLSTSLAWSRLSRRVSRQRNTLQAINNEAVTSLSRKFSDWSI